MTAAGRLGRVMLLALACTTAAAAPAGAQPSAAGWTVSVVAGSLFDGDLAPGEREPTYGVGVGLGVGRGFSLEAEVAAIPALSQFGEVALLVGTGSLLYHPFTAGRVTPYGMLGASLARLSTSQAETTDVELAVDVGGGSGCVCAVRSRFGPTSGSSTSTTRRTSGAPPAASRLDSSRLLNNSTLQAARPDPLRPRQ